uniref:Putative secreted protein n=1 Tax=Anopheles darlingi TaxID=43151 RepID=A0A2M4DB56_ANODA
MMTFGLRLSVVMVVGSLKCCCCCCCCFGEVYGPTDRSSHVLVLVAPCWFDVVWVRGKEGTVPGHSAQRIYWPHSLLPAAKPNLVVFMGSLEYAGAYKVCLLSEKRSIAIFDRLTDEVRTAR